MPLPDLITREWGAAERNFSYLQDNAFFNGDTTIEIGADCSIYRSTTDVLRTDDTFRALRFLSGADSAYNAWATFNDINSGNTYAFQTGTTAAGPSNRAHFRVTPVGVLEWGPGGTTSPNVNLYWHATDVLKTDDELHVGGNGVEVVTSIAGQAFRARQVAAQGVVGNKLLSSDTQFAFMLFGDGKHEWGAGGSSTRDTNLYRSGADILATDDSFTAGGSIATLGTGGAGYFQGTEQSSDPSAPAANAGRIFFKDNGAGKTQLAVRFNTGATQIIATEP